MTTHTTTIQAIRDAERQLEENVKVRLLLAAMCREFERLHVLWPEGVQEWWRLHHRDGHA